VAVSSAGVTFSQSLERGRLVRLPGDAASITSTPALARASDGTSYLHQISASGRLSVRTLVGRRWSRPDTIDGEWSTYASPAVGELAGRLHVAAVDLRGAVVVRAAVPGERSQLPAHVRSDGDPTRSPGLVTRSNAGVFVVATDGRRAARSRLLTRPASAVIGASAPARAGFTP